MEFTTTEKGQRKVIQNGYIYISVPKTACQWHQLVGMYLTKKRQPIQGKNKDISWKWVYRRNKPTNTPPPSQVECEVTKVALKRHA